MAPPTHPWTVWKTSVFIDLDNWLERLSMSKSLTCIGGVNVAWFLSARTRPGLTSWLNLPLNMAAPFDGLDYLLHALTKIANVIEKSRMKPECRCGSIFRGSWYFRAQRQRSGVKQQGFAENVKLLSDVWILNESFKNTALLTHESRFLVSPTGQEKRKKKNRHPSTRLSKFIAKSFRFDPWTCVCVCVVADR